MTVHNTPVPYRLGGLLTLSMRGDATVVRASKGEYREALETLRAIRDSLPDLEQALREAMMPEVDYQRGVLEAIDASPNHGRHGYGWDKVVDAPSYAPTDNAMLRWDRRLSDRDKRIAAVRALETIGALSPVRQGITGGVATLWMTEVGRNLLRQMREGEA